jgi:hypothetical protein
MRIAEKRLSKARLKLGIEMAVFGRRLPLSCTDAATVPMESPRAKVPAGWRPVWL